MGKTNVQKIQRTRDRSLREVARKALAIVVVTSLGIAAVSSGAEGLVTALDEESAGTISVGTFGLVAVLTVMLMVLEVKAWRAVVTACESRPSSSDKLILAGALWFGGGLPLALVNGVRALAGLGDADMQTTWLQVAIAAVLIVLALLRFAREIRRS